MKMTLKIIATGFIASLVVATCFCITYPFYEQRRATKFIDVLADLKPGLTTEMQAREALRKYRPQNDRLVTTHWDIESNRQIKATGYEYLFASKGLPSLHLAKPALLSAGLFFRDGVLALKAVTFQKGSGTCCVVLVKEADQHFAERAMQDGGGISIDKRGTSVSEIIVNLAPNASDEDRRKAYRLNLGCLSPVSRCDSANSLLHDL